jgi:hypothetical protein
VNLTTDHSSTEAQRHRLICIGQVSQDHSYVPRSNRYNHTAHRPYEYSFNSYCVGQTRHHYFELSICCLEGVDFLDIQIFDPLATYEDVRGIATRLAKNLVLHWLQCVTIVQLSIKILKILCNEFLLNILLVVISYNEMTLNLFHKF